MADKNRAKWRWATAMFITYAVAAAFVCIAKNNPKPIGDNPPIEVAFLVTSVLLAIACAAWAWASEGKE